MIRCKLCKEEIEIAYGFAYCKNCWEDLYGEKIEELEEEEICLIEN